MMDWREITRGLLIFPSSVIKLSVMPSAKYSCSGSPDRIGRPFDRSYESVTAPRQCFNPARPVGGIAKSFAQAINGRVKAVLEIHKSV
jgi:hypothetical protein